MKRATLSPIEFKDKLRTGEYILIDIRTPEEFAQGYLPEAQLINFYAPNFIEEMQKLDKNKKYLLYCRSGARTNATLAMMEPMGFTEAYDLRGGIMAL